MLPESTIKELKSLKAMGLAMADIADKLMTSADIKKPVKKVDVEFEKFRARRMKVRLQK